MGFIKIFFYLYSKINSFEYFSKVKKQPLFTKPSFNERLRAKQGLLPFLRYNQTISTKNNPTANV